MDFDIKSLCVEKLKGRNLRLFNEWKSIDEGLSKRDDIDYQIDKLNLSGLPVEYTIHYHIKSICGVEDIDKLNECNVVNVPIFANEFFMKIFIPAAYPCADAPFEFVFKTSENGKEISHPWHPNIRYFGEMAGRVCLNKLDNFTDIVWYIKRVASYLSYERYCATLEAPYPEDLKVAQWVRQQAEQNDWLVF